MQNRAEVLASMGLVKAPELVLMKGKVAPDVAATVRAVVADTGMTEEEVVGIAVADWARRVDRKLAQAEKRAKKPQE